MSLSDYIRGLEPRTIIDKSIIQVLMNPLAPPLIPTTLNACYSAVLNYNYRFAYVPWVEGGLCFGDMNADYDLLSTYFSGCHLARFIDHGIVYGCHIHCSRGQSNDQRHNWNTFSRAISKENIKLFQPDVALLLKYMNASKFQNDENKAYDLWGIITPSGKCISVVVRTSIDFIRTLYHRAFQDDVEFIEKNECWHMNTKYIK